MADAAGTTVTFEELQEAAHKAAWTATPVEGFKFDSVRKYRHAAKELLAGKVGLTVEEQNARMLEAAELLDEARGYNATRDFAAHQAAKAAAREAYDTALAAYFENDTQAESMDWDV